MKKYENCLFTRYNVQIRIQQIQLKPKPDTQTFARSITSHTHTHILKDFHFGQKITWLLDQKHQYRSEWSRAHSPADQLTHIPTEQHSGKTDRHYGITLLSSFCLQHSCLRFQLHWIRLVDSVGCCVSVGTCKVWRRKMRCFMGNTCVSVWESATFTDSAITIDWWSAGNNQKLYKLEKVIIKLAPCFFFCLVCKSWI